MLSVDKDGLHRKSKAKASHQQGHQRHHQMNTQLDNRHTRWSTASPPDEHPAWQQTHKMINRWTPSLTTDTQDDQQLHHQMNTQLDNRHTRWSIKSPPDEHPAWQQTHKITKSSIVALTLRPPVTIECAGVLHCISLHCISQKEATVGRVHNYSHNPSPSGGWETGSIVVWNTSGRMFRNTHLQHSVSRHYS